MTELEKCEKLLEGAGYRKVSLPASTLGYVGDDLMHTVWLPTNVRHLTVEDSGEWNVFEGGGVTGGENAIDLLAFLLGTEHCPESILEQVLSMTKPKEQS